MTSKCYRLLSQSSVTVISALRLPRRRNKAFQTPKQSYSATQDHLFAPFRNHGLPLLSPSARESQPSDPLPPLSSNHLPLNPTHLHQPLHPPLCHLTNSPCSLVAFFNSSSFILIHPILSSSTSFIPFSRTFFAIPIALMHYFPSYVSSLILFDVLIAGPIPRRRARLKPQPVLAFADSHLVFPIADAYIYSPAYLSYFNMLKRL